MSQIKPRRVSEAILTRYIKKAQFAVSGPMIMMKIASKVVIALSFCAWLAALCACQQEPDSGHDIGRSIKKAGQLGHLGS